MTRTDFIDGNILLALLNSLKLTPSGHRADLDRNNIISIDVSPFFFLELHPRNLMPFLRLQLNHNIRPDSMLILQAARQVVEEEGFDETLDDVRERVDEIESLHRTRELTVSPRAFLSFLHG